MESRGSVTENSTRVSIMSSKCSVWAGWLLQQRRLQGSLDAQTRAEMCVGQSLLVVFLGESVSIPQEPMERRAGRVGGAACGLH